MAIKKKKLKEVVKKESKSKEVKFIVVSSGNNDFWMMYLHEPDIEYFSTMTEVLKYLKENGGSNVRVFEVNELKTRNRVELDI